MSQQIVEYTQRILSANPSEALQIALSEAEREKQLALKAQAEYRALSEVDFDSSGRIVKANLAGLWRLSMLYSKSAIVPAHYQGKPEDCFIACQMAFRMRIDPFAYMQASYVVHGKPGIEAKLAVAMINTSGKIKGRIRFRDTRDAKGVMTACTAFAIDAETGDEVSATVTWEMVVAEGWAGKAGSKWKTIPELMFHYRSASFLIRQYYPEVTMGMATTDELFDEPQTLEKSEPARTLAELTAKLMGNNGNGSSMGEIPHPAEGEIVENKAIAPKQEEAKVDAPIEVKAPVKKQKKEAPKPEEKKEPEQSKGDVREPDLASGDDGNGGGDPADWRAGATNPAR